ncbi:MAG: hypothetical protein LBL26_04395 [Peptococcaceae bacterium]|nr:hypothetical protein [Peptococcaceae bacterium]
MREDPLKLKTKQDKTTFIDRIRGRRVSVGLCLTGGGLVVAFLVFYALLLPAIAEERPEALPVGLSEYAQTDDFYEYDTGAGVVPESGENAPNGDGVVPEDSGDISPDGDGVIPEDGGDISPDGDGVVPEDGGDISPDGAEVVPEGGEDVPDGAGDSPDGAEVVPEDSGDISPESAGDGPEDGAGAVPDGTEVVPEDSGDISPDGAGDGPDGTEVVPGIAAAAFSGIMPMALMDGFSSDLADFLTSVAIRDANDNIVSGDVRAGETYYLEFRFDEVPDGADFRQFKYNDQDLLTYLLPTGVTVPSDKSDYIAGSTGSGVSEDLGVYEIATSGGVTVRFYEVDKAGTETSGTPFFEHYADTYFTLNLEATFDAGSSGGPVSIDFSDSVTIDLTVDATPGLAVTKTAGSYDPETRAVDYTVVVTALGRTVHDITLTDDMILKAAMWGQNTGVRTPPGMLSILGRPLVTTFAGGEIEVDAIPLDPGTHGGRYSIPLGVSLDIGQSVTVTYSVRADDALFDHEDNRFGSNYYGIDNTVTAAGNPDGGGERVSDSDDASAGFTVTYLEKWGELDDTDGDGVADVGESIAWGVRVGDGVTDLRGATITDTLGSDLKLETIDLVWLYSGAIDPANFIGDYTAAATLTGSGLELTVPSTAKPVMSVVIGYTSTITGGYAPYFNNVSLRYPGKSFEFLETASVVDDQGGNGAKGAEKTGVLLDNGDEGIRYTISLEIPGELYGKVLHIQDTLRFLPFDGGWRSMDNKPTDMEVVITKENGGVVDKDAYSWVLIYGDDPALVSSGFSSKADVWYLLFNAPLIPGTGLPNEPMAKWNINEDSVVTMTYTLPPAAKVLEGDYAGMTLAEALDYGFVTNEVYMDTDDGDSLYGESYLSRFIIKSGQKIYKSGNSWIKEEQGDYAEENFYKADAKGFFYTVRLNPARGNAPFNLAPAGIPPVFSDSFDSRLILDKTSVEIRKWDGGSGVTYTVNSSDITVAQGGGGAPSTFSFNFANVKNNGQPIVCDIGNEYYVRYRLLLPANTGDLGSGVTRFPNTATVTVTDSDGNRSYSADAEVDYGKPIVTKKMTPASNTTVNVVIIVNPKAEDLAVNSDTITVIDTMSDSLAFIDPSKIEVTKEDGAPLDSGIEWVLVYAPEDNSVTFENLPDNTAVKITYKALVKGAPGETVDIANTVVIDGYSEDYVTVKESFVIMKSSASAGGSYATLYLRKTDEETGELPLPGAGFALYKKIDGVLSGHEPYPGFNGVQPPSGVDKTKEIPSGEAGAGMYYYIMWAETSGSGMAVFDHQQVLTGRTFLLVETQAPAGYVKSEEPLLFYMRAGEDDTGGPPGVPASGGGLDSADIVVANRVGARFPETGGSGAAPYTAAGAVMMAFALGAALTRAGWRRRFFNDSA